MTNFGQARALIVHPSRYGYRLLHTLLFTLRVQKVHHARTSHEALACLRSARFHIVFHDEAAGDIRLFLHQLRRDLRVLNIAVPVVFVCGESREATVKDAQDAGVDAIIAKPASLGTIEAKLRTLFFAPRAFVAGETYIGSDRRAPRRSNAAFLAERRTSQDADIFFIDDAPLLGPS